MSKLQFTYFFFYLMFALTSNKAQNDPPKNLLAEYISTGEMNLQWNSDKEILIIASPHKLRNEPNKKTYSYCTKFGGGASYEDGFIVYKGKKKAIVVSGLQLGQYYYFTSYEANEKGIFNVPGPPLCSFVAWSLGSRAEINFKATTVSPDEHFIIERSDDGLHWSAITTIQASQELKGVVGYNYIDKGPLTGDHFYRLHHSTIGSNYITSEPTGITSYSLSKVFETFASDEDPNVYFVVSDINMELNITNGVGELIRTVTLEEKNNFAYTVDDLPNGIYNISGINNNGKLNSKIAVNR